MLHVLLKQERKSIISFVFCYKEHSCCLEDPFVIKYDYPADGKEEKTMDGYIISDTLAAMMRRELKVYY